MAYNPQQSQQMGRSQMGHSQRSVHMQQQNYQQHQTSMARHPHNDMDATEIGLETLNRSTDGRNTTFETRMAMQRELDGVRQQAKTAERQSDDTRRQAIAIREEAALHRTENLRLQDELRSCKARLNSALESQQDLLQKNSSKHEEILKLQTSEASLRDELASKMQMVQYLEEHNKQIEDELRELKTRGQNSERSAEAQLQALNDTVANMRTRLAAATAENDSMRAAIDALQADIRRRDAEIIAREQDMNAMERERMEIREELRAATSRFHSLSSAQEEMRQQLHMKNEQHSLKAEESDTMRTTVKLLTDQLAEKDNLIARIQNDFNKSEVERMGVSQRLSTTERALETRLNASKAKEKALSTDLKQLHRYLGKREMEVLELADELDSRDSALAGLSASRRLHKYLSRKAEREEAERIEILARHRARKAMGY